jgi:hypothetical protein
MANTTRSDAETTNGAHDLLMTLSFFLSRFAPA